MSERDKREWAALKADPERYRLYLEQKREQRARRQSVKKYETTRKRGWRQANRERDKQLRAAHRAVEKALVQGKIQRPKFCGNCKTSGPVEAHHYLGYAPEHHLEVIWLCQRCHSAQHTRRR